MIFISCSISMVCSTAHVVLMRTGTGWVCSKRLSVMNCTKVEGLLLKRICKSSSSRNSSSASEHYYNNSRRRFYSSLSYGGGALQTTAVTVTVGFWIRRSFPVRYTVCFLQSLQYYPVASLYTNQHYRSSQNLACNIWYKNVLPI